MFKRIEVVAIFLVSIVALVSIVESSYLGINGAHTFRQADQYSQILGMRKHKGFEAFELFSERAGNRFGVYDIPVYSYLVASVSRSLHKDLLVAVRYVNAVLWIISAFYGYRIARSLGARWAGLLFLSQMAISPLMLHYFSVPLADIMAIALSSMGLFFFLRCKGWKDLVVALFTFSISAVIKSPIPFIFIAFGSAYLILTEYDRWSRGKAFICSKKKMSIFLIILLMSVMGIEFFRGLLLKTISASNHNLGWYFGDASLRLSKEFWITIMDRANSWIGGYFLLFVALGGASMLFLRTKEARWAMISGIVALLSGWLIFANVYFRHDYYQIPVAYTSFLSVGVAVSYPLEALKRRFKAAYQCIPMAIAVLALLILHREDSLSHKTRTDFWRAAEFCVLNDREFLFVSDLDQGPGLCPSDS